MNLSRKASSGKDIVPCCMPAQAAKSFQSRKVNVTTCSSAKVVLNDKFSVAKKAPCGVTGCMVQVSSPEIPPH